MKRRMLLATVAALVLSLSTIDQASAQKKPITLPCPSDCIALGGERGDYFKHYGEPVREVLSGIWADLPLAVSDGTPANMKWVAEHPESYGLAQGNVYVQLADQYTGKLLILRSDGIGNEAVLAIVNEDRYKRAVEAGHGTPSWNYISANADKARFVTSTEASGPGSTFKQLQGLLDSNGLTKASKVQYLPNIDEALKAVVDGSAQVAFMVQAVIGLANRIIDAFKTPFVVSGSENLVGASIGIAIFPADGGDGETLLKNADIAMYAAKVEKGGYCFYSHELYARRESRLATEQEILRALKDDEFIVYYQPRLRPATREIVGMEALVRWANPTRGLVPPDEFIPIAESSDLIVQLGEVVAAKVAWQIKEWVRTGHAVVPVSINVSARQFRKGRVRSLIARLLDETHIDASLLEVEITESAMMSDEDEVGIQLAALDKMGVRTHVDDFGTGYSSLSLLQRLSLDVLKIDRAFTATLGKNPESEIFFRAIVSMGHALGMEVVAEGVETEEQLALIIKLGCDEAQGYLFAKPMPALEAGKLMLPSTLSSPLISIA